MLKDLTPTELYYQGLITEEELARLYPDDYSDLRYAEKAEIEKWAWLNQNLGVGEN